jgi:hypothetical protein
MDPEWSKMGFRCHLDAPGIAQELIASSFLEVSCSPFVGVAHIHSELMEAILTLQ